MLTNHTKNELEKAAIDICKTNNLQHAYFTQKLGIRRHYLAGYGKETFTNTHHVDVTETIIFSWQGNLTEREVSIIVGSLAPLAKQVEQELN